MMWCVVDGVWHGVVESLVVKNRMTGFSVVMTREDSLTTFLPHSVSAHARLVGRTK